MSLRSMTGYGRGEARVEGVTVEVELSSVNRKQLDLQVNLPRPLQMLEPRVLDDVGRELTRGRITINVYLVFAPGGHARSVTIDKRLAETYVQQLRRAAKRLGLKDDLGLRDLLTLPDLVQVEHVEEDIEAIWPALKKALAIAVTALVRMRGNEGRALQRDLLERFTGLGARVDAIAHQAPEVAKRYRGNLMARLREAGVTAEALPEERVLREVALFAERSDISEEITRLKSHLVQARKLMRAKDAVGRSLDFLAQEMFREINTVGSKANDTAIVREVVQFKAELERIREQVQNVE